MGILRVGLGQIAPQLGKLEANLDAHRRMIDDAKTHSADLLVFPELGLTGYLLQDLNSEVAMRADDPRLLDLGRQAGDMSTRTDRSVTRSRSRTSRATAPTSAVWTFRI